MAFLIKEMFLDNNPYNVMLLQKFKESIRMKYLLVLAFVLLLVGLAVTGSSYISEKTYKKDEKPVAFKENNTSSVSGYFKAGEKIIVEFTPGENWSKVMYPEDDKYMYISFNITDLTTENTTTFEVELFRPYQGYMPSIYKIRLLKHGSLLVNAKSDNQTNEIGGVVTHDDDYIVLVNYVIPETAGFPLTLTLYRGIPQESRPYGWLFLPGSTIIVLGVALTVYGLKKRKSEKRRRKVSRKR